VVNAMTRMRYCTDDGVMEFRAKGGIDAAPPGYRAWFDVPDRQSKGFTLVCGHWSALGLLMRPDLLALDSGCIWGGALSAVRLEDRRLFQVPCAGYQSSNRD
jgi:bis(5'-nucleosyl)-tetraphosphatase (symmetrical)